MRVLSFIIILLFIAAFVMPVRIRQAVQRRVDRVISESFLKQLLFIVIVTGCSFVFLLLIMTIIHGDLILNVSDWMLSFINPGMFFSSRAEFDGSEKTWGLISGFAGIIFVSGLIISVIGNVIERRVDNIRNGSIHYYFNNHIVIIGYDRMSVGLIGQFAKDQRYSDAEIVLMTTQAVPGVRHELFSRLDSRIEKKVTIVSGNRTSAEDLKRLQINRCREVFILGEKEEYDNDSLDIECIKRIYDVLSEKQTGRIVRCNV
ncbi:MAG: hypothetical protein LBE56_14455, partial [Tannerella sp.]|nr:hypothetical protein [Tannerella sp.]